MGRSARQFSPSVEAAACNASGSNSQPPLITRQMVCVFLIAIRKCNRCVALPLRPER